MHETALKTGKLKQEGVRMWKSILFVGVSSCTALGDKFWVILGTWKPSSKWP